MKKSLDAQDKDKINSENRVPDNIPPAEEIQSLKTSENENEKLVREVKQFHPRWMDADKKRRKFSVCGTNTGCFGCCCGQEGEITDVSINVSNYFKTIKSFTIVFSLLILINGFSYYWYVNIGATRTKTFQDQIFSTTIGTYHACN
jgi:hypothetical protein